MDCKKLVNTVLVCGGMDLLALLSCRQAFQRSLLSTEAQGKLYHVQGLGHNKTNDGLGTNVCLVILFIHAILIVTQRQG